MPPIKTHPPEQEQSPREQTPASEGGLYTGGFSSLIMQFSRSGFERARLCPAAGAGPSVVKLSLLTERCPSTSQAFGGHWR